MHLSPNPLGSSPYAPVFPVDTKQTGGGDRAKKKGIIKKVEGSKVMVVMPALTSRQNTHTYAHSHGIPPSLHHTHTHTHTHQHTHSASTLRSCRCVFCFHTCQSRSNDKAKNQKTKGGKGGSPRLSGMTKIKAFKRIKK